MSEPFLPLSVRETLRLARLSAPSGSTNADMIDGAEDWMRVGARQLIGIHAALDQLDKIGGTFQEEALFFIARAVGR